MVVRNRVCLALAALALTHCSSSSSGTTGGSPAAAVPTDQPAPGAPTGNDTCLAGHELTGAAYDITKSRFAFGGMPIESDEGANKRWSGPQGQLLIMPFGAMASANGGAPSEAKADWSNDPTALTQHVTDYFVSQGVARCQIQGANIDGGSRGRIVVLRRAIDGILVASSNANARMNVDDQSNEEALTWPTIPATVVSDARAFRDSLATADGLAAYQAKLPAPARGKGTVQIVHSAASATALTVKVVWATSEGQSSVSFDPAGVPVNLL